MIQQKRRKDTDRFADFKIGERRFLNLLESTAGASEGF